MLAIGPLLMWLFWLAPIVGAAPGAMVYRVIGTDGRGDGRRLALSRRCAGVQLTHSAPTSSKLQAFTTETCKSREQTLDAGISLLTPRESTLKSIA
jgi:hypothetical protein